MPPRPSREAQYGNGMLGRRRAFGSRHMSTDEIEQILRIQWKSLHSGAPYHEDYYYQVIPLSCSPLLPLFLLCPQACNAQGHLVWIITEAMIRLFLSPSPFGRSFACGSIKRSKEEARSSSWQLSGGCWLIDVRLSELLE